MVRRRKQPNSSDDGISAEDVENRSRNVVVKKKKPKVQERNLTISEKDEIDGFYGQEQVITADSVSTSSCFRFYPNTASTLPENLEEDDKNWIYISSEYVDHEFKSKEPYSLTSLEIHASVPDDARAFAYNTIVLSPYRLPHGCTKEEAGNALIAHDPYFADSPGVRAMVRESRRGVFNNLEAFCLSFAVHSVLKGPEGEEIVNCYPCYLYGTPPDSMRIVPRADGLIDIYMNCQRLFQCSEGCLKTLGNALLHTFDKLNMSSFNWNRAAVEACEPADTQADISLTKKKAMKWMINQESENCDNSVSRLEGHMVLKVGDQLIDFVDGVISDSISAYWNETLMTMNGGIIFHNDLRAKMDVFKELILEHPIQDFSQLHMTPELTRYLIPSKATLISVKGVEELNEWRKTLEEVKIDRPSLVVVYITSENSVKISDIMVADIVICSIFHAFLPLRCSNPNDAQYQHDPRAYVGSKAIIEGFPESLDAELKSMSLESFYYYRAVYDSTDYFCNPLIFSDWRWIIRKNEYRLEFISSMLKMGANLTEKMAMMDKFCISI